MTEQHIPIAVVASQAAPRAKPSIYPEPFASRVAGREKRPLGDLFGLTNFGVNLTRMSPGAGSALRHAHATQDEFLYIVQGDAVLVTNDGETPISAGMCAGFKFGTGNAHQLLNRSNEEVIYLEVGDRSAGDSVVYPDDDLHAALVDGKWQFSQKDGTPY
ncbi:MAG: cupin domain-containing protein [Gallionella sp.]